MKVQAEEGQLSCLFFHLTAQIGFDSVFWTLPGQLCLEQPAQISCAKHTDIWKFLSGRGIEQ